MCATIVFIYLFIYLFIYYYYWVQETRKQRTPMSDKPNYLDLGGVVYRWHSLVYLDLAPRKCITKGMDGWMDGWMDGRTYCLASSRSHRKCFGSCVVGWFINNKFSGVPF
jgi:hypothetical protein